MRTSLSAVSIGVVALGGLSFANNLNGPWEFQPLPSSAHGPASDSCVVPYLVPAGFKPVDGP